jgi:dihydroorotate dehydrogenase
MALLISALLLLKVLAARDEMQWGEAGPPPLLVKIAPDLSKQDLADIAAVMITYTEVIGCFLVYCTIYQLASLFLN